MRVNPKGADMSAYVESAGEALSLLAEARTEELAAVYCRERYREGEIDAGRFRDEVGEASIRASRVKERLAEERKIWTALVAESGAFPSALSVSIESSVFNVGAVCSRLEELEREASAAADRQAEIDHAERMAARAVEESPAACRGPSSGAVDIKK